MARLLRVSGISLIAFAVAVFTFYTREADGQLAVELCRAPIMPLAYGGIQL
jgi:hypothetical protein